MTYELRLLLRQLVDRVTRDGLRPARCRICVWCGGVFVPRSSRQRYCSGTHRKMAWREMTPQGRAQKKAMARRRVRTR